MKNLILGTHAELINDPEGAYTQLVRMQEGAKHAEFSRGPNFQKADAAADIDQSLRMSSSQRMSMKRSTSNGSARHSFTITNGVPGFFDIQEAEISDGIDENDADTLKKRKRVSIRRLAYLNKPEVLYLLLGSIGAGAHGVVLPIFGLLLSSAIKIFFEPPHLLRSDSKFWGLMFAVLGICTLVALPVQNYFFGIAGGKLIQRIRSLSFKKIVHQEISWFDDPANSRSVLFFFFII